jgi:hypothetical protein
VLAAVLLSEAVAVALLALSDRTAFAAFSRSVFAIDAVVCALIVAASRCAAPAAARAFPVLAPGRAPRGAQE